MAIDRFLGFLSRARYPKKFAIFYLLDEKSLLSGAIRHKVGPYEMIVPADEFYFWKVCGPKNYQKKRVYRFAKILNSLESKFALFDCGADIGTVSVLIRWLCPNVQEIIAFEPNPNSFSYLCNNLQRLNIPNRAINAGVSNTDGFANFTFSTGKGSVTRPHGWYRSLV